MATYKVPQDVEADDKLLGPFSFKQFIFLLIAVGSGALAYFLSKILLPLFIIPLPVTIFFLVLALPLKKDQPMEIYLAAIVSFYVKPRKKIWDPDGIINNIEFDNQIIKEDLHNTQLSYQEANAQIDVLTKVVDTQGMSIINQQNQTFNQDIIAESQQVEDIHDQYSQINSNIDKILNQRAMTEKNQIINKIKEQEINKESFKIPEPVKNEQEIVKELSHNNYLSIETTAKEYKRRKKALIDQENSDISLRK